LKLSMYLFSHGLPGSMRSALTPTLPSHSRTAFAVNSGPLSERMCSEVYRTRRRPFSGLSRPGSAGNVPGSGDAWRA
jgi:hypothetical protein